MKIDLRLSNPLLRSRDDFFARSARLTAEVAIFSNRVFLRYAKELGKPIPALYDSGVRYKNETPGKPDQLVDIPTIMARGWGDCFHLSAWLVAELREAGESRARIRVTRVRNPAKDRRTFHVLVRRGNGETEDPSRILGMK
jgi:hypothetical protein